MSTQIVIPPDVLAELKIQIRQAISGNSERINGNIYKVLVAIVTVAPDFVDGKRIEGTRKLRLCIRSIVIANWVQAISVLVFLVLSFAKGFFFLIPAAIFLGQYLILSVVQTHLNIALASRIFWANESAYDEWLDYCSREISARI